MNIKKIIGCVLSGGFVLLYYVFLFFFIINFYHEIPISFFIFLSFLFLVPIIGIVCVLVMRFLEIRSGEEEEAKKY